MPHARHIGMNNSKPWRRKVNAVGGRPPVGTKTQHELTFSDVEAGLTLLGLLGISDPPREAAIRSVRLAQQAGIRVKMITGDHGATAQAIAAQLGIGGNRRVLAGPELETLDDAALRAVVLDTDVYARASPEHKLRLVAALQDNHQVVAMTGDGVNDAPALKRADVGVAMGDERHRSGQGSGGKWCWPTTISPPSPRGGGRPHGVRQSAQSPAVHPADQRRRGAGDHRRYPIRHGPLPLTPVQVLWVNMVTAVTLSLSLAFEPAEANVMRRRLRDPGEPLVNGFMLWRIALVSVLLVIAPLSLFLWQTAQGVSREAARTVAVNALVIGEICYLFNSRFMFDSRCRAGACWAAARCCSPSASCWHCNWPSLISPGATAAGHRADRRRRPGHRHPGRLGGLPAGGIGKRAWRRLRPLPPTEETTG